MNMNRSFSSRLAILCLALISTTRSLPGEMSISAPKEVADLAGIYTGSWTMFGINNAGEPVRLMSWSDVMTAEKPAVQNGKAFVTTTDEMKFDGRPGEPVKVLGKEGYRLKSDGSLGDYFIETAGQMFSMVRLSDTVWTYTSPATAQELTRLGFPAQASARHVVVKMVANEQGVETHRISRLTTATWIDNTGAERTLQFISLQGVHRRKK